MNIEVGTKIKFPSAWRPFSEDIATVLFVGREKYFLELENGHEISITRDSDIEIIIEVKPLP